MDETITIRTTPALSKADRDRFAALISQTLPRAYSVALHLTRNQADAEDVVQEAALHALRGFNSFKPGSNFRAWFLKIVTNAFLMRCRKNRKEAGTVPIADVPELYLYARTDVSQQAEPDPARAFFSRLDTERVQAAIQSLPTPFRTVATLYFVEDLSYAQIADIVGCPRGTVRSRLHRARALLQKALWDAAVDCNLISEDSGAEPVSASAAF